MPETTSASKEAPAKLTQARDEAESLVDRIGVLCFRVANRVFISTLGGVVLPLFLGKPKPRRV